MTQLSDFSETYLACISEQRQSPLKHQQTFLSEEKKSDIDHTRISADKDYMCLWVTIVFIFVACFIKTIHLKHVDTNELPTVYCAHVHTRVGLHVYACICICTQVYDWVYICKLIHTHTHSHTTIYTHMHTHTHTYTHTHIHTRTYTRIYTYTSTHTRTHAAGRCFVMTNPPRAAFSSETCLKDGDVAQWYFTY